MRASLFLSSLFVASLVAGTAAAERPDKDESRPRITRTSSSVDKARSERLERGEKVEKVEKVGQSFRYQGKESNVRVAGDKVSKAEQAARLPKQAMERMRCSAGEGDCGAQSTARKTSQTNADRGVKTAKAAPQASQQGSKAPSAAERAMLQKILSAKCSAAARGGCASDGSDNF